MHFATSSEPAQARPYFNEWAGFCSQASFNQSPPRDRQLKRVSPSVWGPPLPVRPLICHPVERPDRRVAHSLHLMATPGSPKGGAGDYSPVPLGIPNSNSANRLRSPTARSRSIP